jgi:COP9 signalosome complex subunit 3
MSSLNHIVATIQQVDKQCERHRLGRSEGFSELEAMLSSRGTDSVLKQSSVLDILSVLEMSEVDAREHQVGYLFLLDHLCASTLKGHSEDTEDSDGVLSISRQFLLSCTSEDYIGYSELCKRRLVSLCLSLGELCLSLKEPKHGIIPLVAGLNCVLQGEANIITPIHQMIFKLCLASKCYSKGASIVISQPPMVMEPKVYGTSSADVLLYFYYGGMILTGLKRYGEALDMFVSALVTPAFQASVIAINAMKKYIVLSLLVHGEMKQPPPYTPAAVMKLIKTECEEYVDLADKVVNSGAVEEYVQEKEDLWRADGTFGLIKLVLQGARRRTLANLGDVYTCMPKEKVFDCLSLKLGDDLDREMLKCAEDLAYIDDSSGLVHFSEHKPSSVSTERLLEMVENCLSVKRSVDFDMHTIACSAEYIKQEESKHVPTTRAAKAPTELS